MSEPEFYVQVGKAHFIDDQGNWRRTPHPGVAVYSSKASGLPINPESIQKVFQGIEKALPNPDDPKSADFLRKLGLSDDLLKVLGTLGKVAGIAAKVFIVAAVAVEVLKLFGILSDKSDSEKLHEHLTNVERNIVANIGNAVAAWQEAKVDDKRRQVQAVMNQLGTYLDYLAEGDAVLPADLLSLWRNLYDLNVPTLNTAFEELASWKSWQSQFLQGHHDPLWRYVRNLYFLPNGVDASDPQEDKRVPLLPDQTFIVDSRMLVPQVLYVVQAYLSYMSVLVPEYRSVGTYRRFLRTLAGTIEDTAEQMRRSTLARTVYRENDFLALLSPDQVVFDDEESPVGVRGDVFPVGAVDLQAHSNWYYDAAIAAARTPSSPDPARIGTLTRYWTPPAHLRRIGFTFYQITNPAECAAAANALAEEHYAELLYASGYLNLVHLAAQVRQCMAEPRRSQTVSGNTSRTTMGAGQQKGITVRAKPIPLSPEITAQADRELRKTSLRAVVTTQSLGGRPIRRLEYRLVLRTFPSFATDYSAFYSAGHVEALVPDPADDNQLYLSTIVVVNSMRPLADHVIATGYNPDTAQRYQGDAELDATTFDWWIPTSSFIAGSDARSVAKQVAGLARKGQTRVVPAGARSRPAWDLVRRPFGNMPLGITGSSALEAAFGSPPVDLHAIGAQQREGQRAKVRVGYDVSWEGNKLEIALRARPQDRNFVAFLVVEEKMALSQTWIHTAFPFSADGHLTYVPKEFFERERAAQQHARRVLTDIAMKHTKVVPVGPADPVVRPILLADVLTSSGLSAFADRLKAQAPELWQRASKKATRRPHRKRPVGKVRRRR